MPNGVDERLPIIMDVNGDVLPTFVAENDPQEMEAYPGTENTK
jgi:hypothetical protein